MPIGIRRSLPIIIPYRHWAWKTAAVISGIHLDPNSGHLQFAIRTYSEVFKTPDVVAVCFGIPLEGTTPYGKYALLIMVLELPYSRRANNGFVICWYCMNFAFIYITGVISTSGRLTILLFSAVDRLASAFIKHSEPLISETFRGCQYCLGGQYIGGIIYAWPV